MHTAETITALAVLTPALAACSPREELAEQIFESEEDIDDLERAGSVTARIPADSWNGALEAEASEKLIPPGDEGVQALGHGP